MFFWDSNRLIAPQHIRWQTSIQFSKSLYGGVHRRGYQEITLDFSKASRVYPNGIVPIIAELDVYRNNGLKVNVIPPSNPEVLSLFQRNDWMYYLSPDRWSPDAHDSRTQLALQVFRDDSELNSLVNKAIDICLQQLVFASGVPQAFEWVLNEITGNVLDHSKSNIGWMQVVTYRDSHKLALIVFDSGLGVPTTMSKRYQFRDDTEALELAVRQGSTSDPEYGQGNGLAGAIAIAQHSRGLFAITSGRGRLRILEGKVEPKKHFPPLNGTCVEMQFSTDTEIDLPKALWGNKPIDYFETKFENDGNESEIDLREYASSFGNRVTGEKIRTLVFNIIKQTNGRAVRIQMHNVSIVSSSFADEFFGKLFIELGPLEFGRLIKVESANSTCKSIIDQAISQRMVHNMGAPYQDS